MHVRNTVFCVLLTAALCACTGTKTFTTAARPGETVALAIDRQANLKRANVTVTITPATGAPVVYPPLDTRVRSILNLYPDPVSKAVVLNRTDEPTATGSFIDMFTTGGDPDWWQTFMLIDLPQGIAPGVATISIVDTQGALIEPVTVEVLTGASTKNVFEIRKFGIAFSVDTNAGPVIHAPYDLERVKHTVVEFTGTTVPYAIQIEFTHTTGANVAYAVNPRGDLKNLAWVDDGARIKVILTPAADKTERRIQDFKFYLAGNLTGLIQTGLKAYDQNGGPVPGIAATLTQY